MLLPLQTQCQFVTNAVNRYENYSNKIKQKKVINDKRLDIDHQTGSWNSIEFKHPLQTGNIPMTSSPSEIFYASMCSIH